MNHLCGKQATKHGRDRNNNQRYKCRLCNVTFLNPENKMNSISEEKRQAATQLLKEGSCSLRQIARETRLNINTVMSLKNQLIEKGVLDAGAFTRQSKRNHN